MLRMLRRRIGSTLLALLLAPSASWGQGFFYREVEKEGRIYVFNNAEAYVQWEKSGEAGKSITRIGFGPNGGTVVFDSEEAINAYLFKHDRPGEVIIKAPEKKPKMTFSWRDGKTTFSTDLAELKLSNRVQVRSTLVDPEAGDTDTIGSFRIRRTKTKFEGWFYDKNLEFELQMNWPSADIVEDANLNWVIGRDRSFMLKAGSFKVPFGRQELTSSGSQQFVDRSLVSNEFARGRDLGIQLWGELMEKKIDWRVGVFNGAGFGRVSVNDNDKYEFVGRVQFHPNGDPKYSEVDFDSKDTPLFAIAGEFDVNDLRPGSNNSGVKRQHFGGDVVFKYKGLFAFGEAFFGKRTNVAEEDTDVRGFNLQAGYLVIASKLEIAGRYASLDLDTDADDNERTELGGAISYYYNKHNLKWQNDFRVLEDKAKDEGERKTFEFRSQLQFIF